MNNDYELSLGELIYRYIKQAFNSRLSDLQKQKNPKKPNWFSSKWGKLQAFNPQFMVYAGGMFSSSNLAFNARAGMYLSNSFNIALDMSVMGNPKEKSTYFNIGLAGYQRLFQILMVGLGINERVGGGSGVFSIKTSAGVSFVNKDRTASTDIFFDVYAPLKKGEKTIFGFSIGRSIYWTKIKR